jgi:hypothetical protein
MTQNGMTNDEAVKSPNNCFAIFLTFENHTTKILGKIVENFEKSKINPPYIAGPFKIGIGSCFIDVPLANYHAIKKL